MQLTEQQIIKACQRGNKPGQYELVRRYSGMLMTICLRYAPDRPAAKDILQESFIAIFRNIDNYKPTGSFEGWIRQITVRSALRWLRDKKQKEEAMVVNFSEHEEQSPEIYSQLKMEELVGLIQQLPAGFRTVFNLNVIEGYAHKEIANMLDITESASRSQLSRARKILQQKWNALNTKNVKSIWTGINIQSK